MKDTIQMLFELHKGTPRQGPGTDEATRKALSKIILPADARVLDIGSGTGKQTMVLVENIDGIITANDIYQPFLDEIVRNSAAKGFDLKIQTELADMGMLPFDKGQFDMIWSEGSIFVIGFDKGIELWKEFLKPGGFMVVSDLSWIKSGAPDALVDYWKREYPAVNTIEGNVKICEANGFDVVDTFILEKQGWTEEYYAPLKERLPVFVEEFKDNPLAKEVAKATELEMKMYDEYNEYYGYVFYIIRKA